MKGSRSAWELELRKLMREIGLNPCRANGYVWMRVAVNTSDLGATDDSGLPAVERYYEYILMHVDNFMIAISIANQVMQFISKT